MKWTYIKKTFNGESKVIIQQANEIIEEYQAAGYSLTLRQLYYQFVARDILPNNSKSYDRLGSIINNARLAGLIDWSAIEDRTRNLRRISSWNSPADIMRSVVSSYRRDLWEGQKYRPEVWIEKDALIGVIESVCSELRIPSFSCRGYVSQSEMWAAGQRFVQYRKNKQIPLIIHMGDHDPSGIDMSRDIQERLNMFVKGHMLEGEVVLMRVALNIDQVKQYSPPPNPAKTTDSRFSTYMEEYGDESWELDALGPDVLSNLIRNEIAEFRNDKMWNKSLAQENKETQQLEQVREDFESNS